LTPDLVQSIVKQKPALIALLQAPAHGIPTRKDQAVSVDGAPFGGVLSILAGCCTMVRQDAVSIHLLRAKVAATLRVSEVQANALINAAKDAGLIICREARLSLAREDPSPASAPGAFLLHSNRQAALAFPEPYLASRDRRDRI
jgi:hypothetical protein